GGPGSPALLPGPPSATQPHTNAAAAPHDRDVPACKHHTAKITAAGQRVETEVSGAPQPEPTVQANKGIATPTAPRMVVAPPLVHIPEEASRPPPVSPKSAKTRAKWLSLTEGGMQRVTQVISMSKHQGSSAASAKTSEGGSSSGGGSNCSESPYYRITSDRDSGSIVTIDAHAPHHPVVRVSASNGKPWEWRNTISGHMMASDISVDKHRAAPQRQDSVAQYRDYRTLPVKTDSQSSSSASGGTDGGADMLPPPPHPDLLMDGHSQALSRTSTLPRRPSVSARSHAEQEHYYKAMQNERML
uniref:Uncharacterized protein n=1 Tax=Tetraodon nigroviridis TaxID=99883 RepID=H3CMF5_TETNG